MLCASVNDAVGTDVEVTHFRQQVDSHIPGPRVARVNQCAGVCAFSTSFCRHHGAGVGYTECRGVFGGSWGRGLCRWVTCRTPALPLRGRVDSYINSSWLPWMSTGQALAVVPRELLSASPARQPSCTCAIVFHCSVPAVGPALSSLVTGSDTRGDGITNPDREAQG